MTTSLPYMLIEQSAMKATRVNLKTEKERISNAKGEKNFFIDGLL
jgi:hypothetical protein